MPRFAITFTLALACDMRLCAPGAKFATSFKNMALSGDYGASFLLQRLLGPGLAPRPLYAPALMDIRGAAGVGCCVASGVPVGFVAGRVPWLPLKAAAIERRAANLSDNALA